MLIKRNKTILIGKVISIRLEPDGDGANIDLEVFENKTQKPDEDYLKTRAGETISLYYTEPDKLYVGDVVETHASLSGGPFGQRAIIETVEKVPSK